MRDRFARGGSGDGFQAHAPGGERRFSGRASSRVQGGNGPRDRGFGDRRVERAFQGSRFVGRSYPARRDTYFDCVFPSFEQMARHWLGVFLTPVPVHLLTLALLDLAGRRHGERVDHGLRLLQAHDGATQMVLQPQPHGHEGVHHIWG